MAFLNLQFPGLMGDHAELGSATDVLKTDGGFAGVAGQKRPTIDQAIYTPERGENSDANDQPFAPVADHHRHCGLHHAGCAATLNESQRGIATPKRSGSVKPSQQFMVGLFPSFILPPPKRSA